jgi:protein arginine N-methyltransferase 1
MTLASSGIASLRQFRRWFRRRVLQDRPYMDGNPYSHERAILDGIRCDAYQKAIQQTVKPGDVVVDLGAGTGLLSFFAAQAGARHVYAIEVSSIADVAAELIEANGFRDRITLIRGNSKKVHLPERCNVLVTETLSSFCFDEENIIESVADARERFLNPGGQIIPQSADTFLLPFSADSFGVGRLVANDPANKPNFYGLDYRLLAKKLLNESRLVPASGKPILALSEPALCYHIDFHKETRNPEKTFVPFRVTADGRLDGFLGWFEARLCEGVTLSNSPHLPLTSWWQLYLPAIEQLQYHAGQVLLLCLDPNMVDGGAQWRYSVQTANSGRERK